MVLGEDMPLQRLRPPDGGEEGGSLVPAAKRFRTSFTNLREMLGVTHRWERVASGAELHIPSKDLMAEGMRLHMSVYTMKHENRGPFPLAEWERPLIGILLEEVLEEGKKRSGKVRGDLLSVLKWCLDSMRVVWLLRHGVLSDRCHVASFLADAVEQTAGLVSLPRFPLVTSRPTQRENPADRGLWLATRARASPLSPKALSADIWGHLVDFLPLPAWVEGPVAVLRALAARKEPAPHIRSILEHPAVLAVAPMPATAAPGWIASMCSMLEQTDRSAWTEPG
eukprot:Hpha_TRINITY_DN16106_c1_g13::TRINITY_DN16106_c1_g13_i1::g.4142::m.4142